MLNLVIGGAASGKSEFAERLACIGPQPRIYLATMQPLDDECHRRIEKHQQARAGRGFETVECYTELSRIKLPEKTGTVLLECLSNLCANELYGLQRTPDEAEQEILSGVRRLCEQATQVVIVSNEVFLDGVDYPQETQQYLQLLGRLNCALAAQAERVVEVVYSIPVFHKGEPI